MSFRRSQSQLVKGHHLTTCLQDPAAGTIGYPQSADLEFGDILNPDIISDCSHNNSDSVLTSRHLHLTDQTGDGDGRPVGSAHEEPPQDDLVEGSIRAAGQEPVQLDQEPQIDILALWFFPVHLTVLVVPDVDSGHQSQESQS